MSAQLVYVSIGNSDDALSQAEWSRFASAVRMAVHLWATRVHADCAAEPTSAYQNLVLGAEFDEASIPLAMAELRQIAETYCQASIAWAPAAVEFITTGEET